MTDSSDPDRTDGGFDDPTAPPWTSPDAESPTDPGVPTDATQPVGTGEPTQPIPAATPPLEPFGIAPFGQGPDAETPYPQQPSPPSPYGEPPSGETGYTEGAYGQSGYGQSGYEQAGHGQAPYAQAPYAQAPYGQEPYGQLGPAQTPSGQQPYGSTAYGQPPYALPPAPYGAPRQNGSALALTIVSAIATVLCCLFCLPSLILGIVALSKQSTDPQGAAKLARWGWYALAGAALLAVTCIVAFFALGAAGAFDSGSYDYEGV